MAEALGLLEEQMLKMDAIWEHHKQQRRAQQRASLERQEEMWNAVEAGRWDEARRENRQISVALAAIAAAQPEMKIKVLSLLTPEQLQRIQKDFSDLFRRPWSISGTKRAPMRKRERGRKLREGPREPNAP